MQQKRKERLAEILVVIYLALLIILVFLGVGLILTGILHNETSLISTGALAMPIPILTFLWVISKLLNQEE